MSVIRSFAILCAMALLPAAFRSFAFAQETEGSSHPEFIFGHTGGSYIGVFVAEIDADRAKTLKLPEERGVEITRVEPDSPAAKAGLRVGDVVLSYDGQPIEGMEQFRRMIRETPAGRRATLSVFRSGATQTISVTIGALKPRTFTIQTPESIQMSGPEMAGPEIMVPDVPKILPGSKSVVLGVETEALSPQLAHFFGVNSGVLIRSVLSGTPAERAGLRAGDVVTKADDAEIASPGRLSVVVRAAVANQHPLALTIIRNKEPITLTVLLEQQQDRGTAPSGRMVKPPVH